MEDYAAAKNEKDCYVLIGFKSVKCADKEVNGISQIFLTILS